MVIGTEDSPFSDELLIAARLAHGTSPDQAHTATGLLLEWPGQDSSLRETDYE
jgi:hypothetical protein